MQSRGAPSQSCRLAAPGRACNQYYSPVFNDAVIPADRAVGFIRGSGADEQVLCQDATDLYMNFRKDPRAKVPVLECDLSDEEREQIMVRAEALLPVYQRRRQPRHQEPVEEEQYEDGDDGDDDDEPVVDLAAELAARVSQPVTTRDTENLRRALAAVPDGEPSLAQILAPVNVNVLRTLSDQERASLLDRIVNERRPDRIAAPLVALGTSAFLYRLEPIVIDMIQTLGTLPPGHQRALAGLQFTRRGDTAWKQHVLERELMRVLLFANDWRAFDAVYDSVEPELRQVALLQNLRDGLVPDERRDTVAALLQQRQRTLTGLGRLPIFVEEDLRVDTANEIASQIRAYITDGNLYAIEKALAPDSYEYKRLREYISRDRWTEDLLPWAVRASAATPSDTRRRLLLERLLSSTLVQGDLSEFIHLANQRVLSRADLSQLLAAAQRGVLLPDAYRYALYAQNIPLLLALHAQFGIDTATRDALLQSAAAYDMAYMSALINARLVPNAPAPSAPAPAPAPASARASLRQAMPASAFSRAAAPTSASRAAEQPPPVPPRTASRVLPIAAPPVAAAPLLARSVRAPASEPDAWTALQEAARRNDLRAVNTLLAPGSFTYRDIYAIPYETRLQTLETLADAASPAVRQRLETSAPFLGDPPLSAAFPLVLADLEEAGSSASLGPALTRLSRRRIARDRVEQVAPDLIRYAKFRNNPRLEQDVVQRFEGVTLPDDVRRTPAPASRAPAPTPAPASRAPISTSRAPAPASGASVAASRAPTVSRAPAPARAPASRTLVDPPLYEAAAHDDYAALVELLDANQDNLTVEKVQMLIKAAVAPRRRTAANRQVRALLQSVLEALQE